jgi:hypothetical protein
MKKIRTLFIILVSTLLLSLLLSNVSNAILASDQLEVGAGSKVEGKLLIDTAVATDQLVAYVTISVPKIYTPTDIPDKLILVEVRISTVTDYGFGFIEDPDDIRLVFLIFYDNRTTIMLAEFFSANSTDSIEMTVLDQLKYADLTNPDNRKITFGNGTTALAGTLEHADPKYILLEQFSDLSNDFLFWHKYTLFAISPTAVIGDDINYDPNLGLVIGTPAVTTSEGDSYDAICVEYYDTVLFNDWGTAYEVIVCYEAATGFILRVYEYLDQGTWKFIPGVVDVTRAHFSTAAVILGIAAIGIIVLFKRKRK